MRSDDNNNDEEEEEGNLMTAIRRTVEANEEEWQ